MIRKYIQKKKDLSLLAFFMIIPAVAISQFSSKSTVSGKITDATTGAPIPNINLFFAYTTMGSITDKNGEYRISNVPPGQYDLVVSHIGYELKTIQLKFLKSEKLVQNIQLTPRILKGEKIKVETTTPDEWKNNLKTFLKLFIGKTKNSRACKITNPEVINFKFEPETKVFTAFTDSLVYMFNQALGYEIDIILDFFNFNQKTKILKYQVFPKFKLMKYEKEKQLTKWQKNRQRTYEGSFRHFITALAKGRLEDEKFELYQFSYYDTTENIWLTSGRKEIKNYQEAFLSPDTLGLKRFHFNNFLYCDYESRRSSWIDFNYNRIQSSWLELISDFVQIDTLGNCYDELGIIKRGYWGRARMADVLPFDYEPNNK